MASCRHRISTVEVVAKLLAELLGGKVASGFNYFTNDRMDDQSCYRAGQLRQVPHEPLADVLKCCYVGFISGNSLLHFVNPFEGGGLSIHWSLGKDLRPYVLNCAPQFSQVGFSYGCMSVPL